LRPTLINSSNYKISFTKCHILRIYQDLDIARIPTPFCFNRHPSPFTFAFETFGHLFSHYSSTNSTLNCQSTTTGLTNLIDVMSSDIKIPTNLTHHLSPNRQIAHKIPSTMCPSSSITLNLIQGPTPMLPSYITLMQLYRTI
jgi:hypothetical protein